MKKEDFMESKNKAKLHEPRRTGPDRSLENTGQRQVLGFGMKKEDFMETRLSSRRADLTVLGAC